MRLSDISDNAALDCPCLAGYRGRGLMESYDALAAYLAHLPADTVKIRLTFEQVEGILGRPLPIGAWHYRTWWAFPGGARVPAQVQAWRAAGWRVYLVDQHAGWVWFKRKQTETE